MASDSVTDSSSYNHPGAGIGARATWGFKDLLIVIGLGISTILVFGIVFVAPISSHFGKHSGEANFAVAVVSGGWELALAGLVYWRVRRSGGNGASLGLVGPYDVRDTPWRHIGWHGGWSVTKLAAWSICVYIASTMTVQIYVAIMKAVGADALLPDAQLPTEVFDHWWVVVPFGLSVVFIAPFCEEICFRGFAYGAFRRRYAILASALASGVLFSLAHGQLGLILPFALVGAYFAYTYERTGTLFANMSVHFIFNAISFMVLILVPDARS